MPNFANKSRLSPLDGTMLTAITRTSVSANADASGQGTPKTGIARASARNFSFSPGLSIPGARRILSQTLRSSVDTQPPQFDSEWALIDIDGRLWVSNADLSLFRSIGITVPDYKGTADETQRLQWIGTGWICSTNWGCDVYRVSPDLLTWTKIPEFSKPNPSLENGVYCRVIFTTDPSVLYFISTYAGLYKSTNGGLAWTLRNNGSPFVGANHPDLTVSDGRLIFTRSSGGGATIPEIYTSDDDGASFTLRFTASSGGASILDSSKIGTRFFVGARGGTMYTSTDNGTTWSQITPALWPQDVYVTSMKQHGSLYVATIVDGLGGPGGPAWTPNPLTTQLTRGSATDGANLKGWDYYSMQLRYNGTRFAFTHVTGPNVYASTDGTQWSRVPHPVGGSFLIAAPKVTDPTKVRG